MKVGKKYKVTIEDEAHLRTIKVWKLSPLALWIFIVLAAVSLLICAGAIISFTPIRTLLPGYLKESERSATEEGLLRLDSLRDVYAVNQAFIDNYLRVTDIDREPSDSASITPVSRELSADSLMGPTLNEQKFLSTMEEHERFNISVLAPLAADGVKFTPVTNYGIYINESRAREEGIIVMTEDRSVSSVADGSVIATYYSPTDHGYVVMVQHPLGFVSQYSHVGTPLVTPGDHVIGGQAVARAPEADKRGTRSVRIRMWHNGSAIIPYDYVGESHTDIPSTPGYEAPRGKL